MCFVWMHPSKKSNICSKWPGIGIRLPGNSLVSVDFWGFWPWAIWNRWRIRSAWVWIKSPSLTKIGAVMGHVWACLSKLERGWTPITSRIRWHVWWISTSKLFEMVRVVFAWGGQLWILPTTDPFSPCFKTGSAITSDPQLKSARVAVPQPTCQQLSWFMFVHQLEIYPPHKPISKLIDFLILSQHIYLDEHPSWYKQQNPWATVLFSQWLGELGDCVVQSQLFRACRGWLSSGFPYCCFSGPKCRRFIPKFQAFEAHFFFYETHSVDSANLEYMVETYWKKTPSLVNYQKFVRNHRLSLGGIHLLPATSLPWGGFSLAASGRSCATWHLGRTWGRREGIGNMLK